MFVRLSARSRTHRPCEEQGSAKSYHFCSISAGGSVDGSPAQRAPQESSTHTGDRRETERERDSRGSQSPSSSSFTPLVYKLFLFAAGKHDEWKKTWNQEECRKGWKMDANGGCRMHVMNECIENWWTKEISLHPFVTWRRLPRFLGSVYSGMFRAGTHDEWKKTWQRDDAKWMKNGWTPTGDAECCHLKKNNEWIHREPMDESIFYSSVNVPWTSLLCSFAAGSMMNEKKTMKEGWCNRDEKWMPTGDPKWTVSQDERENTSRLDGRKRYLFIRCRPVRTKACAWETGTSGVFSSLRASCEIGRESRESRVFSLRYSCPARILRVYSLMIFFWRHGSLGFFLNPRNCAFYRYDFRSFAAEVLVASSREMSSCWYDFALAPSKSCSPQAAEALVVIRLLWRAWAARFFQTMENFGIFCERY